jgi:hypothetical protein
VAQWSVIITRETTESAILSIEANSQEDAEAQALAMQDSATFEQDDGNVPQPAYITGATCDDEEGDDAAAWPCPYCDASEADGHAATCEMEA